MRVLTKIDGSCQVDEIFAMDVFENGATTLYTAEHLMNIKVSGLTSLEHERIARELLVNGYADLSRYTVELFDSDEDDEEDTTEEYPYY